MKAGFGSHTLYPRRAHNSISGLGPVLIIVGIVCRVSNLEPGALERCVTDDKHAIAPFSLSRSLQRIEGPAGSC